ncbi:21850_t:CDS:1, partial [Racocetra persica]
MNWDKADHESGLGVLSDFLFGIHRKEDKDRFMDIEFKDSFKDKEIKIFMKVLKKIVEHRESKKNEYQNIKSISFCS